MTSFDQWLMKYEAAIVEEVLTSLEQGLTMDEAVEACFDRDISSRLLNRLLANIEHHIIYFGVR